VVAFGVGVKIPDLVLTSLRLSASGIFFYFYFFVCVLYFNHKTGDGYSSDNEEGKFGIGFHNGGIKFSKPDVCTLALHFIELQFLVFSLLKIASQLWCPWSVDIAPSFAVDASFLSSPLFLPHFPTFLSFCACLCVPFISFDDW
jgi:hypothetical protein